MIIRLPNGEWNLNPDEQLGPEGGFGAVFAGSKEGFPLLAIKKLRLTAEDIVNRELRVADQLLNRELNHVIPIYDSGLDAESDFYYVVMARAEKSLRDELQAKKRFDEKETAKILLQILNGLAEVSDVVHRDLKPGNILFHEGVWKIGDFGIAKFIEESTSLHTLQGFLSPPYAAPEQWRLETVSAATDLYALGCIGYELITGETPFQGAEPSDYQQQHLSESPPPLLDNSPNMRTLINMLLRKPPLTRPSQDRVRSLLERIISQPSDAGVSEGLTAIAAAGAREAERQSEEEAKQLKEKAELEERQRLGGEAISILRQIKGELFQKIIASTPIVTREGQDKISLGKASLELRFLNGTGIYPKHPDSPWDFICGAVIEVVQPAPKDYKWSASLWYTDQGSKATYRWVEISYWMFQGSGYEKNTPFAVEDINLAIQAHSPGMRNINLATRPKSIDDEDVNEFIERWANLLARAYEGGLRYPSHLPLERT